jgi:23S rRNA pseudouridine955/2504/2580 synthase
MPDDLGKKSKTKFFQIEKYKNSALFKIEPITGKTHQIRAHAKYMKTPLAGDRRYGIQPDQIVTEYGLTRLFLHAESITFPGLSPSENTFSFNSELDPKLTKVLEKLRLRIH